MAGHRSRPEKPPQAGPFGPFRENPRWHPRRGTKLARPRHPDNIAALWGEAVHLTYDGLAQKLSFPNKPIVNVHGQNIRGNPGENGIWSVKSNYGERTRYALKGFFIFF
jgi:hypothetical protein